VTQALTLLTLSLGGALGLLALAKRAEAVSIVSELLDGGEGQQRGIPRERRLAASWNGAIQRDLRAIVLGAISFGTLRAIVCGFSPVAVVVAALLGALAGRLYKTRSRELAVKREIRKMEFYLPAVMERIVMAVSSGLDIVPALREASRGGIDPVSGLLERIVKLSEAGTPVDAAFESVAMSASSVPVRHALTHLALAHRQGGEIVRPLKELSDATQTAYQESVEEMIAKLPVKAVLPLVLTFTGLIICFLTVPLMQVGAIATKVAHVTK